MRLAPPSRLWMILALALLVALIYWPSAVVYNKEWLNFANITFTHGWLVVAVCLALVLRSRGEIAAAPVEPQPWVLVALGGSILAWLVCYRASIQGLHITVFPAIFWLAVTAALGLPVGRLLAFPVVFFYFAVPSVALLGNLLQALTVHVLHGLLWLTGPSASISGDIIRIPNGSFLVEEGCSGLHFMIVGLAVAALHGELRRDPWRIRAAQLALMGLLALLANWVRVYIIIEAGYLTNMQSYLVRVSHYWFGWGVFAVALIGFFGLAALLGPPPLPEPPHDSAARPAARGPAVSPAALVSTVLLLAGLPALSSSLRALQPPPDLQAAAGLAARPPWSPVPADSRSSWLPTFPGADQQQRLAYQDGAGHMVEVFRVAYRNQHQGAKLIGMGTTLVGRRLHSRSEGVIDTVGEAFRESEVVDRAGARSLIWSRYETAGRDFVSPLAAQLWYGINATVSNPPAALIAYRSPCGAEANCEEARRLLRGFVASTMR
jgi:exosortase